MRDVYVIDDKCSPVSRISGDTNNNNLLDVSESWIYTCRTNITTSTRNTATALGKANGFTSLGYAFATVLVSGTSLPDTGSIPTFDQQIRTITSNLRQGNSNNNVKILQRFLISQNRGSKSIVLKKFGIDGKFGPITKNALAEWQTANGLTGDGILGPKTRAYLSAHY
jgi:peptidoglycan hydrolase-like protein with peptidoglycan-binding domain